MLLVSISFDGLLSTPQWVRFENAHRRPSTTCTRSTCCGRAAFLVLILFLYGLFLLFSLAVSRAGGRR